MTLSVSNPLCSTRLHPIENSLRGLPPITFNGRIFNFAARGLKEERGRQGIAAFVPPRNLDMLPGDYQQLT